MLFGQTYSLSPLTSAVTTPPLSLGTATIQEITTQNTSATPSVRYVTAFQAAPIGTPSMDATSHIVSTDQRMEGIQIWNQVVLFGRNGDVDLTTPVDYQAGSGTVTHYVVNLKANQAYQVSVNGSAPISLTASANGVLSFNSNSGGAASVDIRI